MDWSQDKCLLMIEAYQNARCLWDPTFENYKNTIHKQDAWQEIANLLEMSVEDVKKKMDSLLASYRRERQKSITTKSGSGADSTYNSKWFAFKSMHFLMDKYKPRKTLDTQNKNTVNTTEQENKENEQEEAGEMDTNGGSQRSGNNTISGPQPCTSSQTSDNSRKQSEPDSRPPLKKKKTEKTEDPRVSEAYNILKDTYQSKIRDRSHAFGHHVALKHREYSKRTQAIVEHHINNILFDADMGKYESRTVSTPMSSYSDSSQNAFMTANLLQNPAPYMSPENVTSVSITSPDQQVHSPDVDPVEISINNTETENNENTLVYYFNTFKQ